MKFPKERPAIKLRKKDIVKIINPEVIKKKELLSDEAEVFALFADKDGVLWVDLDFLPKTKWKTGVVLAKDVVLHKRNGKLFTGTRKVG